MLNVLQVTTILKLRIFRIFAVKLPKYIKYKQLPVSRSCVMLTLGLWVKESNEAMYLFITAFGHVIRGQTRSNDKF